MMIDSPEQIRILFVDDEISVLNAMLRLFHDEPYHLLTASGGPAALELLHGNSPVQLIIADYRMPGMNGVEFLQRAMLQCPDTRRVILSGYPDLDVLLAAVNEGRVHRFLVKPWNNEGLKAVVKEMLGEYEMLVNFRRDAEELARNNRLLSRTNEHLSALLADVLTSMRREIAPADLHHPASDPVPSQSVATLSPRENQILRDIASGHALKAIAIDLGLSIKTISTYKKRIFDKMGFRNDAELIAYSLRSNLFRH